MITLVCAAMRLRSEGSSFVSCFGAMLNKMQLLAATKTADVVAPPAQYIVGTCSMYV